MAMGANQPAHAFWKAATRELERADRTDFVGVSLLEREDQRSNGG